MFFEYIYLDVEKVKQFSVLMSKLSNEKKPGDGKRGSNVNLNLNVGVVKAGYSNQSEESYGYVDDDYSMFQNFQELLEKEKCKDTEHFIDADDYNDTEYIEKLKRGKILKFDGELMIPEKFGEIEFMQNLLKNDGAKNAIMDGVNIHGQHERQIFELFFGKNKKTKIPVYFEVGEYLLYGLLENDCLKIEDYSDFENLSNQEMTVYAKIEKVDNAEHEFEIIDVYKDVLGMNRAMRRGTTQNSSNNSFAESVTLKGKGIKASFIALLK